MNLIAGVELQAVLVITCVNLISIRVFRACPIFFISISPGVDPPGVFSPGVSVPNGVVNPPNFCSKTIF